MSTLAVILAAGLGKRMKSTLPKVLHPILGDPSLLWVLRALPATVTGAVVVVHHGKEQVQAALATWARLGLLPCPTTSVDQLEPLGTGHAVQAAAAELDRLGAAKVLILSAHSDDAYVETVTAMGAVGYLIKQSSANVLSEAIREVHKGHTFFSPSIAKQHKHHQQPVLDLKGRSNMKDTKLTSRELEVRQLIAEGSANKQVASELGISVKTVEKHRDHLMQKLDIHDTAGLTRYAIATGIIESSVQVTIV